MHYAPSVFMTCIYLSTTRRQLAMSRKSHTMARGPNSIMGNEWFLLSLLLIEADLKVCGPYSNMYPNDLLK